jgi:hypothetical protein
VFLRTELQQQVAVFDDGVGERVNVVAESRHFMTNLGEKLNEADAGAGQYKGFPPGEQRRAGHAANGIGGDICWLCVRREQGADIFCFGRRRFEGCGRGCGRRRGQEVAETKKTAKFVVGDEAAFVEVLYGGVTTAEAELAEMGKVIELV